MDSITVKQARRLALTRAGLLRPERSGLPSRAAGRGRQARSRCHAVVERFGYLQLDTVSIAGARAHCIVLASRLENLDAALGEALLEPGAPLFEYWGHEACWMPLELYPAFGFRRKEFRVHPWWGDLLGEHRALADRILARIDACGPLRSLDLEGSRGGTDWWDSKLSRRVAEALWSSGDLAIRERKGFQRSYDLTERVIPDSFRSHSPSDADSLDVLLLKALDGHGWATAGTLASTWRLVNRRDAVRASLERLAEGGHIVACRLQDSGRDIAGWIRPRDLELMGELDSARPRWDQAVLLSPFDPLLWERDRVMRLFHFEQVLEIYKPARLRRYGYYCMPVLAGERLVARVDLKAERQRGRLRVLACHLEPDARSKGSGMRAHVAVRSALERYARAVGLALDGDSA